VDKYHGTGDTNDDCNGNWTKKEYMSVGKDIGVYINPKTGKEIITNRIAIHYSKTGTHIVPVKRRD